MAQPHQEFPGNTEETKDRIEQFKARASEAAETAAEEGRKVYQSAERKAGDAYDATRDFVNERPLAAVGIAVGAAFAIGALWKLAQSRRNEDLADRIASYIEPHYRSIRRRL